MSAIQNLQPFGERPLCGGRQGRAGPGLCGPSQAGPRPVAQLLFPGTVASAEGGGGEGERRGRGFALTDGRGGQWGARRGGAAGSDGRSPQTPLLMQVRVMTCFLPALRTTSI